MKIVSVTGAVNVEVDDVDIEQARILHPKVLDDFPIGLQAMMAAYHAEPVTTLQRQLGKYNSFLNYTQVDYVPFRGEERWLVHFEILKRKAAAEESDA